MITEDYVSFETAKLLKEKGFDEATNRYYNAQCDQIRTVSDTFMWHWNNEEFVKRVLMDGAIAIPTLQMTMKWLREVHKLHIWIAHKLKQNKGLPWYYEIHNIETGTVVKIGDVVYGSYEVACEAAIKYCLEKLI